MALVCVMGAWAARPAMAKPGSAEDAVMAAEKARDAALMSNDFATLDKIMADDVLYCHGTGRVDNKAAFLNTLKTGGNRYTKYELSDAHVHVSGNLGVINGTAALTVNPAGRGPTDETMVVTLVYEKRGGEWKLISSQSTRKPEPGAPGAAPAAPAK
jgi:ketosteroid isomerase-like protein